MSVLAIDLGTSGPKVGLVRRGRARGISAFEPVPLLLQPGGGAEQRPEDWWAAVVAAARRLPLERRPRDRHHRPVGGHGGRRRGGRAAGAGRDLDGHARRRGGKALAGARVRVAGYDPRKLARWVRRTGGAPSLSGRDSLGHILWLRAERPAIYGAAACFLEPVDWLGFKLSGRIATTGPTATLHWVTDTRDASRVTYDDDLLAVAGLRRDQLPELLGANAVLGTVSETARAELGLRAAVPVVAGTPDTMSAAVGSGATADHAAHLYVGTSSWLSCHVPYKRTDPLRSVASLPSALPGRWLVSCEQETAGASVTLARDLLAPAGGYAELDELAGAAPPGAGRRAVHAVAERGAHPGRRPRRARRPAQPHAGDAARGRRARRAGGRGAEHALDAGGGGEVLPAVAGSDRVRRRRRALGAVGADHGRRARPHGASGGGSGQRQSARGRPARAARAG